MEPGSGSIAYPGNTKRGRLGTTSCDVKVHDPHHGVEVDMPIIEEVEDVGSQLVPYGQQGRINIAIPSNQLRIPRFFLPVPTQSYHEEQLARLQRRRLEEEQRARQDALQRQQDWQLRKQQQGQLAEVQRKGSFLLNQDLLPSRPSWSRIRKSAKDILSSVIQRTIGGRIEQIRQPIAPDTPSPALIDRIDNDQIPIVDKSTVLTPSDYKMPFGMKRYGATRRRYPYMAVRRAYKTGIRRGRWPPSKYATIKIERGGSAARALGITPGAKYSEVNPNEQALRKALMWRGRGMYGGSGGYLGQLIGSAIGGIAANVAQQRYPALSAVPNLQNYGAAAGGFVGDAAEEAGRGIFAK